MAATTTELRLDLSRSAIGRWQRFSNLVAAASANTAATATQLSQYWKETTDWAQAFTVSNIELVSGLRIAFWGAGSVSNAITAQLYGWHDDGPGNHIGTVTAALIAGVSTKRSGSTPVGFHTSPDAHKSVYGHFNLDTDYHPCDTYAVTSYEGTDALAISATHANFPGYVTLSLENSQYTHVGLMFTSIASTNVAALCKVIGLKSQLYPVDGT